MTSLSVNINKVALIRNSRGGNLPNLLKIAQDCERFGADGITVHPRPDERHIRYKDVMELKSIVTTELNVEGNPTKDFLNLVLEVKPHQVTLVPDSPDQLTSDHGWDTIKNKEFLIEVIQEFKNNNIRTSIFVDPIIKMIEGAIETGTDRVELYTEFYAKEYPSNKEIAIKDYLSSAQTASELGLGINAGHDLNLENLKYFAENIKDLKEVSIGHALISDSLYFGLENTIQMYLKRLKSVR
jgi:pyridoxine 5-phosphate synthase